ncbi:cytochrome b/b6 domain-containing protein [Leucobacter sp. OH1287]|uniref:cytochrome b/b6 domain-containing protein n=1 Tax=Leucobacter sp. OH1287 TaxID=2491049 RepID=UPI000F5E4F26|nr:cytochrome b/b6 domain-containing protein [Leucobacter sp. OH1287]RRD61198.1 cytochrome b/b6 domain-containing protein [Leucobacter sp. OH1287]
MPKKTDNPGIEKPIRRGLPRVSSGDPWPPESHCINIYGVAESSIFCSITTSPKDSTSNNSSGNLTGQKEPAALSTLPTVAKKSGMKIEVRVLLLFMAAALMAFVIMGAQSLVQTRDVKEFITLYPGVITQPLETVHGVPIWLSWQHFLNAFFMVLIIRSGLQIRRERNPRAFWSPRWNRNRKISLTVWLHQMLDLLWLLNGVIFIFLLFATGQWVKIVPLSWEVFPHSVSVALQYASLDWPTENGWIHYNALQQLAYTATVFVAAPLAALTGFRLGSLWPTKSALLSRLYPVAIARKLHFYVMIYFVFFIVVHVTLVFSTGALRNLNHMFAAQGSSDPSEFSRNWLGFWLFMLATAVTILAAWFLKPRIISPLANLLGRVSSK